MSQTTDYLIVGGGTAGCALATRLKQKLPHASVTLLEAGSDEHKNPLITDLMGTFQLHFTDLEYKNFTVPQATLDGRRVFSATGRMLSGSSACNYGMWTRGPKADYDFWAQQVGDKRWSYDGLLPYFKRTETHYSLDKFDATQHGDNGPMRTAISTKRPGYPLKTPIRDAFLKSSGLPWNEDPNNGNPIGVGPFSENWLQGVRQPSGLAYNLKGVNVVTEAPVKRILFQDQTAIGVELIDQTVIKANKEVVVSCGAFGSPRVLTFSGIGPKEELARLGIEPVLSNEAAQNIGANLSDHTTVPIFYKLKHPEQNLSAGAPGWTNPDYLLGMPVDIVLTSNHTNQELKAAMLKDGHRDISDSHPFLSPDRAHSEIIPMYAGAESLDHDLGVPLDGSVITVGSLCLLPTSRGSVKFPSSNLRDEPLIDPNYMATEVDKVVVRQALRTVLRAFETEPLAQHIEGVLPSAEYPILTSDSSDADLDAYAKRMATTWFHPSGTCAMGKVVDANCSVIGLKNLRVVDASIFPEPLATHYQAPTYAVAEQAADIIAAMA